MSEVRKLSLNVTSEAHERLEEIANDLGVTSTEAMRRALGLLSIVHTLLEEDPSLYICTRNDEGSYQQLHMLNSMLY